MPSSANPWNDPRPPLGPKVIVQASSTLALASGGGRDPRRPRRKPAWPPTQCRPTRCYTTSGSRSSRKTCDMRTERQARESHRGEGQRRRLRNLPGEQCGEGPLAIAGNEVALEQAEVAEVVVEVAIEVAAQVGLDRRLSGEVLAIAAGEEDRPSRPRLILEPSALRSLRVVKARRRCRRRRRPRCRSSRRSAHR